MTQKSSEAVLTSADGSSRMLLTWGGYERCACHQSIPSMTSRSFYSEATEEWDRSPAPQRGSALVSRPCERSPAPPVDERRDRLFSNK